MVKAADKNMKISNIRLILKDGGKDSYTIPESKNISYVSLTPTTSVQTSVQF